MAYPTGCALVCVCVAKRLLFRTTITKQDQYLYVVFGGSPDTPTASKGDLPHRWRVGLGENFLAVATTRTAIPAVAQLLLNTAESAEKFVCRWRNTTALSTHVCAWHFLPASADVPSCTIYPVVAQVSS